MEQGLIGSAAAAAPGMTTTWVGAHDEQERERTGPLGKMLLQQKRLVQQIRLLQEKAEMRVGHSRPRIAACSDAAVPPIATSRRFAHAAHLNKAQPHDSSAMIQAP
eukprot:6185307-Pleurochrysis_carterae.AAC.3